MLHSDLLTTGMLGSGITEPLPSKVPLTVSAYLAWHFTSDKVDLCLNHVSCLDSVSSTQAAMGLSGSPSPEQRGGTGQGILEVLEFLCSTVYWSWFIVVLQWCQLASFYIYSSRWSSVVMGQIVCHEGGDG